MTNKINGQFVPLTETLLSSKAWRAANVHGHVRRLFDFLVAEHMRHGGQENGKLMAPWRQLADFDTGARIPARLVGDAIDKAIALGIVDVCRGDHRRPSTYGLTMLALFDGTPPSNRFTECDAAADAIIEAAKQSKRRPTSWTRTTARAAWERGRGNGKVNAGQVNGKVNAACMGKVNADLTGQSECISRVMHGQSEGITPQNLTGQSECTLEKALPGAAQDKKGSREGSVGVEDRAVAVGTDEPEVCSGLPLGKPDPADAAAPHPSRKCPAYVTNDFGFKICGRPAVDEGGHCAEHAQPRSHPASGKPNGQAAL